MRVWKFKRHIEIDKTIGNFQFAEKEIWNYEFFVKADFLIGAEEMKETIGASIVLLASVVIISFLVIRPLVAIGDIPDEIRRLRESVDNLSKIIKEQGRK